jgi:DNA-binding response OmpR family regulator
MLKPAAFDAIISGDMALDTHAMVVDLVRTLRHQLRTPVNHIVGFTEMLQEEAADRCWDTLLPDLDRIREIGRSLADFIANTVDIAKVEAGKLDANQISRDLRTPMESVIGYSQLLQEIAEENGWPEALPDLQKVESAANYLTSLIQSVLDLSAAYAAGIPDTSEGPGRQPAGRQASGRTAEAAPSTSHGLVLLAEDNPFDGEMLTRRLNQLGYTVEHVPSGREALDTLVSRPFDVVLLDVLMPELDGFETLTAMKESEALRHVPVIMISALEEVPIVVRCVEMGADDYLAKPIDPVLLGAKVDSALEKSRLRAREREYLAQVNKVTAAAAALEANTFAAGDLSEVARRDDSLGRLARVFERMAVELRAREESLQEQVTQLRIEIDQVKLSKDVAAITGADYFQEVRRRGQQLRAAKEQRARGVPRPEGQDDSAQP